MARAVYFTVVRVARSPPSPQGTVAVVAVVDRKEGGAANFAARDLSLRSLLSIEDFGITPPQP